VTKLLIVDDDDQIRNVLVRLLSRNEFECRTASTVEEATAAINDDRPEAVLLDVTLGTASGLRMLHAIRSEDPVRPPVVVMTSRRDLFAEISTEAGPADDWIIKPWDANELIARLFLAIRRARASRGASREGAVNS
jgi:DNA-binding response OmpR family regulator